MKKNRKKTNTERGKVREKEGERVRELLKEDSKGHKNLESWLDHSGFKTK